MPKTKVDHDQVAIMSRYLPNRLIADRLGISERQVTRILKDRNRSKKTGGRKHHDPETEAIVMESLKDMGLSYGQIGYRFGVSRQAVQQKLTQN